jgi:hypothetical protein
MVPGEGGDHIACRAGLHERWSISLSRENFEVAARDELFGRIGLGLISLGPHRILRPRGRPGIVFGRAAPRRYAVRLAADPVWHVRQPLARGFPGAGRQRKAGKTQQGPFGSREATTHLAVMPPQCGARDAQSWPGCGEAARAIKRQPGDYRLVSSPWFAAAKRCKRLAERGGESSNQPAVAASQLWRGTSFSSASSRTRRAEAQAKAVGGRGVLSTSLILLLKM